MASEHRVRFWISREILDMMIFQSQISDFRFQISDFKKRTAIEN